MNQERNTTDPQEDEKNGNILGGVMDKIFGNAEGDNSLSEDEDKEPGNQESIKDKGKE